MTSKIGITIEDVDALTSGQKQRLASFLGMDAVSSDKQPASTNASDALDTDGSDDKPDDDGFKATWDARIHAANKATHPDGRFKLRRGVDRDLVEVVIGEQKALAALPAPAAAPLAPPAAPLAPPAAPLVLTMTDKAAGSHEDYLKVGWTDEMLIEQGYATMAPAPLAPPAPLTPPAPLALPAEPMKFSELVNLLTNAITDGKTTNHRVNEVLNGYGLPKGLPDLATRMDFVPRLLSDLGLV